MENKYITVLDFEISRIFQYKVEISKVELEFESEWCEDFLIEKGHRLNNCEWMVHDIGEIVDHTIKSTLK